MKRKKRKQRRAADSGENRMESFKLIRQANWASGAGGGSVTVLNINSGYNENLKETCRLLREYMQYVEKVRVYTKTIGLN